MEQVAETFAPDPELKPCPFCGAHAWMHISPSAFTPSTGIGYRIECEGPCHAMTCWWHKRAQAVKAWNMRSAHSASTNEKQT